MLTSNTPPPVYTDFSGLTQLRAQARQDPDNSLREVARQFESIYVQMMLKSMRDASFGDPLFDSTGSEMYRDMFDNQMSQQLTHGKGLGLAEMLVQQLRRQQPDSAVDNPRQTFAAPATAPSQPLTSPESFKQQLLPHAKAAAAELGTTPDVLLAQAALETGWGKHVAQLPNGRSSHNLFNIKADPSWQGDTVQVKTVEYLHGKPVTQTARFRAYDDYAESFQDYMNFIKSNPRYRAALAQPADSNNYIQQVHGAGYATDPAYADKWLQILQERFPAAVADLT